MPILTLKPMSCGTSSYVWTWWILHKYYKKVDNGRTKRNCLPTCPLWLDTICGFEGVVNMMPQEADGEKLN